MRFLKTKTFTQAVALILVFASIFPNLLTGTHAESQDAPEDVFPLCDDLNHTHTEECFGVTVVPHEAPASIVYFDLALGKVTIGTTCSGYVYVKNENNELVSTYISKAFDPNTWYYVFQSNPDSADTKLKGYVVLDADGNVTEVHHPAYDPITHDTKAWGDHITGNHGTGIEDYETVHEYGGVLQVEEDWNAAAAQRKATANYVTISIAGKSGTVVLDDIWTKRAGGFTSSEAYGGVRVTGANTANTKVTLMLTGDNRLDKLFYYTGSVTSSNLIFTSLKGTGSYDGTLTVIGDQTGIRNNSSYYTALCPQNNWNSAIGGADTPNHAYGFVFEGGTVYAGTTPLDNCTSIGGGGNGHTSIEIKGGRVTAVSNSTGTAIGGGIGHQSPGGQSTVTITGGLVHAYNFGQPAYETIQITETSLGVKSEYFRAASHIPGTAIGGGSSIRNTGSKGTVTISGNTLVYAESLGGAGIGGGNSVATTGGPAEVTVNGGTVFSYSTAKADYATVDGTPYSVAIGAGIGGGSSNSKGAGGNAFVIVTGGDLTATSIGGGNSDTGKGGNIVATGGKPGIYFTGGTIRTGSIGGGTNGAGQVGYASALIEGGDIRGQFVMKASDQGKCKFTMTGGIIHDTDPSDPDYTHTQFNGGAVYMEDDSGTVEISGGTIENCSAEKGGAIYMTAGNCTISNTAVIQSCFARENGGAVYMNGGTLNITGGTVSGKTDAVSAKNGGAIYMENGVCTVSGTSVIRAFRVSESGGAVYMGGGKFDMSGGSVTGNYAAFNGGGVAVNGGNVQVSGGAITDNTAGVHGGGVAVTNGDYHMVGGNVDGNGAGQSGGGIYVAADGADVDVGVYSGSVSGNSSGTGGGALAVLGQADGKETIRVQIGVDRPHFSTQENGISIDCDHDYINIVDDAVLSCPQIKDNHAETSGGGIYVTGNDNTRLDLFCLVEEGSTANGDRGLSNFMKMDGGVVTITTSSNMNPDDETTQNSHYGNTQIHSSIYDTGGKMDIWGNMTNPDIRDIITVDILKDGDYFDDHRLQDPKRLIYKLLYYENFLDPQTGVVTGQYTEIPVVHGQQVAISGNIYSHPGYAIRGWNTSSGRKDRYSPIQENLLHYNDSDPMHTQGIQGWYQVNESYLFDDNPIGDLTIYAIWEAVGYPVYFRPNAEDYSGSMEGEGGLPYYAFIYDMPRKLPANGFSRTGYKFLGWAKTPDGPVVYEDEQEVVNLTTVSGQKVELYAQWEICDHSDTDAYIYSLTDNGKTLRRDCTCGAYHETAALTAQNVTYDRNPHAAEVAYSSESWQPQVVYTQGETVLDEDPVNAGIYTAKITAGQEGKEPVTAQVTYEITKAEQPAPGELPTFVPEQQDDKTTILYVHPIVDSALRYGADNPSGDPTYDAVAEYQVVYFDFNGDKYATEWRRPDGTAPEGYAVSFLLDRAYTNYYVYARYSECTNYLASEEKGADDVYYLPGDVTLQFKGGSHVKRFVRFATDGEELSGITIDISPDDGYFFPSGATVSIWTDGAPDDAQVTLKTDILLSKYSITDILTGSYRIIVTLPNAQKLMTVEAAITEKQVFGKVEDMTAQISRDSAFTVSFCITDYDPDEFAVPQLAFNQTLPAGTTVIMQNKTDGSYYWTEIPAAVAEENGGGEGSGEESIPTSTAINLESFVRMGTESSPFLMPTGGDPVDFQLQFIVDFSQAKTLPTWESLTVTLEAAIESGSSASYIPAKKAVAIKNEPAFMMEVTGPGALICTYTAPGGAASYWDGKEAALVFIPRSALPADARLVVTRTVNGHTNTSYLSPNNAGHYIYPMADGAKITVGMHSGLLENGYQSYAFDVQWRMSNSQAEAAPMNGRLLAEGELTVLATRETPVSIEVTADARWYPLKGTAEITVEWENLPAGYTLESVLEYKAENGSYTGTGQRQTIIHNATKDSATISFPLSQDTPGSYRVYLSATNGLILMANDEYYFLVGVE